MVARCRYKMTPRQKNKSLKNTERYVFVITDKRKIIFHISSEKPRRCQFRGFSLPFLLCGTLLRLFASHAFKGSTLGEVTDWIMRKIPSIVAALVR